MMAHPAPFEAVPSNLVDDCRLVIEPMLYGICRTAGRGSLDTFTVAVAGNGEGAEANMCNMCSSTRFTVCSTQSSGSSLKHVHPSKRTSGTVHTDRNRPAVQQKVLASTRCPQPRVSEGVKAWTVDRHKSWTTATHRHELRAGEQRSCTGKGTWFKMRSLTRRFRVDTSVFTPRASVCKVGEGAQDQFAPPPPPNRTWSSTMVLSTLLLARRGVKCKPHLWPRRVKDGCFSGSWKGEG